MFFKRESHRKTNNSVLATIISIVFTLCVALPSAYADSSYDDDFSYQSGLKTPEYIWVSDKLSIKTKSGVTKDSFATKAEYWSKSKWGVSGNFTNNDTQLFGEPASSEIKNIDVNRQLFRSRNSANYLAVGLGWQEIDIANEINAEGPSFSLLGKLNFANSFQVYGTSSWFPELDKTTSRDNLSGYQLEAGLLFKHRSSLSLKAGVRVLDLDNNQRGTKATSSSSFLLGTNLTF
ncbi:MAG: hypothetical protein ACRBHB_25370 [Arenicella sp.]